MKSRLIMHQTGDTFVFDQGQDLGWVESHARRYQSASPFPHAVIDDLLPQPFLEAVLRNFPSASECSVERNCDHTVHKRGYRPDDLGTNRCRSYLYLFNSAPFLRFLEALTGTDGLIPDPYFRGGGFHEIGAGGKLKVHTDFNLYAKLKLVRHLNVLIYLNQDWPPDYGGNLELWDASAKQRMKSIEPIFNRCVVFNTDKQSFHGHPGPLTCPDHRFRRSIATYYYVSPVSNITPDARTNVRTDFVDT